MKSRGVCGQEGGKSRIRILGKMIENGMCEGVRGGKPGGARR